MTSFSQLDDFFQVQFVPQNYPANDYLTSPVARRLFKSVLMIAVTSGAILPGPPTPKTAFVISTFARTTFLHPTVASDTRAKAGVENFFGLSLCYN